MSACNFCPDGTDLARKSPPTCKKCYNKQYKRPREKCIECKRNKEIHTKDGRCDSCYRKTYDRIMEICSICKELSEVKKRENGLPICNRCYKSPKRLCFGCKEEKEICVSTPFPICRNCRNKERKLVDEQFRISTILRQRVYFALKTFGGGKIKSADEYGINYVKIIECLSPFPEDTSLYHIDHIFPLCAFNLADPIEIQAAFAPENHRWLKKEDNMSKNGKYNREEVSSYIRKFKERL